MGGKPRAIALNADVDFARDKPIAFEQAWTWLRDNFHDPAMHGMGWNAVRAECTPLIDGATGRLPCITVTAEDGRPMELHPRHVDSGIAAVGRGIPRP
ncbi:MAG: hypothetical protein EPN36_15030 [Rhodanobacteraceae bacterium]|nr:MAG: hypothetical protein EPN36_15030 [Rhodanobacteraceae bacterium]